MTNSSSPSINEVQKRDNYICQYCGKDGLACLDNWHDATLDHVIPLSKGGRDEPANMVASCGYCNSIKGSRVFQSLEEAKDFIMRRRAELQCDFERVRKAVRGK